MSSIRPNIDSTSGFADFQTYIDKETITQMADTPLTTLFRLRNETHGAGFEDAFVSNAVLRIIAPVLPVIKETKNSGVVDEATGLISLIKKLMTGLEYLNFDIGKFPPLNAVCLADDSLLIEWIFQAFRIGFVVETNKEDSSWYLVSIIEKTEFNESGRLTDIDKEQLVRKLVSFLISYT
jgi:hypothetical protein